MSFELTGYMFVSEFMARGSIYDFLHKQKCAFKLQTLLKVALDVAKGMSYLHQNNIIHRDLKTANLLMDEHGVRFVLTIQILQAFLYPLPLLFLLESQDYMVLTLG